MDFNRVFLLGRIASDIDLKHTPSGIPVASFLLVVNRPMSTESRERLGKKADYFPVQVWRQNAEFAFKHLGKGRLIAIEGQIRVREFTTSDGEQRRESEVECEVLKSLDQKREIGSDKPKLPHREH